MKKDTAEIFGDSLERKTLDQIANVYDSALRESLRKCKGFFSEVSRLDEEIAGMKKRGVDVQQAIKKRDLRVRQLMRETRVIETVAQELESVGRDVPEYIEAEMAKIYDKNYTYSAGRVKAAYPEYSFYQYDPRKLRVLLADSRPPFTKLAYAGLGNNAVIVRRLQNQMGISLTLGEGQSKLVKRIMDVTGQSLYQAKRVAQTERTRVQSQARIDALKDAEKMGLTGIVKKWSARMANTRDAHEYLNGKEVPADKNFVVPPSADVISRSKHGVKMGNGYKIAYPGDPSAPARAIINCHCVLIPGIEG